jgi:type IV secretion system protein VirB2
MFRNLFGARLPRLALHTLLLALPFAAILAEPALAQNLDPWRTCSRSWSTG